MYFAWKPEYSVNIKEFDDQHKELFEISNRISDLVLAEDGFDHYDEIIEIFNKLIKYTTYHFSCEEIFMERYEYPGLDNHKAEHAFAIKKLQRVADKDFDVGQGEVLIDLITFTVDWIASHILKTDMEYKDFLNSKGLF